MTGPADKLIEGDRSLFRLFIGAGFLARIPLRGLLGLDRKEYFPAGRPTGSVSAPCPAFVGSCRQMGGRHRP